MSHSNSIFHTALAVSNIKNHVPIILEMENVQCVTWAELFKPRMSVEELPRHSTCFGSHKCISRCRDVNLAE
ncbi:hypothetical protein JHK82_024216 [Glycine max]|nr:hypothetical protein JHK82_024216 [Glycine max]